MKSRIARSLPAALCAAVAGVGLVPVLALAATTAVDCAGSPTTALQAAIAAATADDTLEISGICIGNFVVDRNLTLVGVTNGATLNGNSTGTTVRIYGGVVATIDSLTITGGLYNGCGHGGGIFSEGAINVSNSTIVGNSTANEPGGCYATGGGIYSYGPVTITNSTVTGNSTGIGSGAGGVAVNLGSATLTVTNSTIEGNTNGLIIYNQCSFPLPCTNVHLLNTIVADNGTDCQLGPPGSGSVNGIDGGYNISSDASCGFSGTSLASTPTLLGSLADNGGPTQTMEILAGSPAFDKVPSGTNGCGSTIVADQRGVPRPQGRGCDIGAFEVDLTPDTSIGLSPPDPSNSSSAWFTYSSSRSGSTFSCQLDGGGFAACSAAGKSYAALADGRHTFEVAAANGAYADPTPATFIWTVDTTAPIATIDSGPSGTVSSTSADFTFSAGESPVTFRCSLDGAPYVVCTSPWNIPGPLADGVHSFSVRATDQAGNKGDPTLWIWMVKKPVTRTFRSVGTLDGSILESSESSGVGGTVSATLPTFCVGDDAANRQWVGILHFDTSSLPDTAVVTAATLRIRREKLTGTNPFTTHGGLLADARTRFFGATASLAAADFQAPASKIAVASFGGTGVDGWHSAAVTSAGLPVISRSRTTQFRMRFSKGDNNDRGKDCLGFSSGNASAPLRPQLIIRYTMP